MKSLNSALLFSPTDLVIFWENPFVSWMDRYHLEFPGELTPDETDEETDLIFRLGNRHEDKVIQNIKDERLDFCEISDSGTALSETLAALQEGRATIYQGLLEYLPFSGRSDLLLKVNTPSQLGQYSYEVADIKLSRHVKPSHILQLCCYSELLKELQGIFPQDFHVVLGNGNRISFRLADYFYYYLQIKQAFLEFHENFDPENPPEIYHGEHRGRWTSHAETRLIEQDHLSLVANITRSQIKKLRNTGILTFSQLAESAIDRIPRLDQAIYERLRAQARLQKASAQSVQPKYEVITSVESCKTLGLQLLPPASKLDVYFDMEGYPHIDGGLEYLFGAVTLEEKGLKFYDWWAHSPKEEKEAFEGFVDWAYARWQQDPGMHIYHYASYEVMAMKKLMGRYATREHEIDDLLRNDVFVDLYRIVSQSLRVGEPKYSIKNIEKLYREARTGDIKTAGASVVYFERWLEFPDGENWQTSALLKGIRSYNEDDCVSTYELAVWLREVKAQQGITDLPQEKKEADPNEAESPRQLRSEYVQKLLDAIPKDRSNNEEHWRLQELFAWLIEFHRREQKPFWWSYFERAFNMNDDEIVEDIDCLGKLYRTQASPETERQSLLFEYSYDPQQDTKLKAGESCRIILGENALTVTIASLDTANGWVKVKISQKQLATSGLQTLPEFVNLIPYQLINYQVIEQSILDTVTHWVQENQLPLALKDFLLRNRPTIQNNPEGALIPEGSDSLQAALDVVLNMDQTTLCIQGPPGTGKTYTAAHIILELLKKRKKVGISSNGHKAIVNLMRRVAENAQKELIPFQGVKIGGEKEDLSQYPNIAHKTSGTVQFADFQLFGGTVWAFSTESAIEQLDYLFVDEAGQVAISNLVAMARSTKNIVLMGDQMQLGQPTQGSHPGESGMSILEYYLQDVATIPKDKGIFLGITYRLHPDICRFISETVYEGRLKSQESQTSLQRLILNRKETVYVQQECGILYLPVPHEGNLQSSDEEVQVIQQIVEELLGCQYVNEKGETKTLTIADILLVAPFNMQVRLLKDAIGPEAKVGSVDKFQGQEAPVVIVSMCSSNGNESSRGLDFLLSKNRLNVAVSRAKNIAIIVGSPALSQTKCSNIEQMSLVNLYCRLNQEYAGQSLPQESILPKD